MAETFYEKPILNSPYAEPVRHHALDQDGQPLDRPPIEGRRRSELITPVPKPRKKKSKKNDPKQAKLDLSAEDGISTEEQEYNPTPIINTIRTHVASWRQIPSPNDWGVTPVTARLLQHWRHHDFQDIQPFFCQIEAVETIIWLTEVARKQKQYKKFWDHIQGANEQANPNLIRHAYFLGAQDPYQSLKTSLKAEIDQSAWETLYRDKSRPFPRPESGRFAVKVINHFGDEVMKVFAV